MELFLLNYKFKIQHAYHMELKGSPHFSYLFNIIGGKYILAEVY